MSFRSLRVCFAVVSVLGFAACGGGGAQKSVSPSGAIPLATGTGTVTWTMTWASQESTSSSVRRTAYLAPTARSASINLLTSPAGGPTAIQYLNAPSTTLTFTTVVGLDTFEIKTYDEQNGQGNVLSVADVTQTVSTSPASISTTTLNGVIASLSIAVTYPSGNLVVGTAGSANVVVTAYDADNNAILEPTGSSDYNTPINLSVTKTNSSDPGTFTLASSLLQSTTSTGSMTTVAYNGGLVSGMPPATITASAKGVATVSSPVNVTGLISPGTATEYTIPSSGSEPLYDALGSDGNVWFAEPGTSKIAKVSPAGTITEYTTPSGSSYPYAVGKGPDGNVWFTEVNANKVASVTPGGSITEYSIPTASSAPYYIVTGPDGALWFSEWVANKIGRVTTTGTFNEYPVPTASSEPNAIVNAPDGTLWFVEFAANKIGRITTTGTFSEYSVTTPSSEPYGLAVGPDGNLWFTEWAGNKVGKITTAGIITEYAVPTAASQPGIITQGPDGNLWFLEHAGNKVARITTAGAITEYNIPSASSAPSGIATGSDGYLWFTEYNTNRMGKMYP